MGEKCMIELLRNKQYTLSDIQKLKQKAHVVVDHIDIWLSNLFEVTHPEFLYHKDRLKKQAQFIESHLKSMKRKDLYGSWAYYKGNSTLVHVLNKKDYFTVLTARNHDVFTENEHKLLRTKRIGIIGQSVGGNVAVVAAHAGAGKLSIADFDRLEGTNLNRVLFGSWSHSDFISYDNGKRRYGHLSSVNNNMSMTHKLSCNRP